MFIGSKMKIDNSQRCVNIINLKKVQMKTPKNIEGYERLRIGAYIRKWRNIKDVKQKQLAAALRISEAAISNIENDLTDITLSQIEDIAIALNVPFEDMFADPGEKIYQSAEQSKEIRTEQVMEKDLIYTLLGTIQKKDQQWESWMQKMMEKLEGIRSVS
jgi:transcriptional regulator with XRE-family HTH domain